MAHGASGGGRMELRQLVVYCALAEEMHFGRTAEVLHMAQSSVSQHIRRLEKEIGVRLIRRTTRAMEFTPAGLLFLDEARSILRKVDRAAQATRLLGGQHDTTLNLGANFPAGRIFVPGLLAHLRETRPGLTVTVQEFGSREQERAVARGDLHVGLIYGQPLDPTLAHAHLGDVDMVALVRQGHPLISDGTVDLRRIAPYPFITMTQGAATLLGERVREAARSVGGRLGPERSSSANLFLDLATSDAIAFPSRPRGEQGVASGLVMLDIDPAPEPLPLHLVWRDSENDEQVNIVRTYFTSLSPNPQDHRIDSPQRSIVHKIEVETAE